MNIIHLNESLKTNYETIFNVEKLCYIQFHPQQSHFIIYLLNVKMVGHWALGK